MKNTTDILRISTLMYAAGVDSLDSPSPADCTESARHSGIVILVVIDYDNTYSFNTGNIRYQMSAKVFRGMLRV